MKPDPETGKPPFDYIPGLNQRPLPFKAVFEPRF